MRLLHGLPHQADTGSGGVEGVVAVDDMPVEFHDLLGHDDKRSHHALVLVFEDVAVVHVSPVRAGELSCDVDEFASTDPDRILPTLFVGVRWARMLQGERCPSVCRYV